MREYETIYFLKPDLSKEPLQALKEKISEIIQKQGGHVLAFTDWGKRRLAYRVEKFHQGHYFYVQYLDPGVSIAEIERILKYDDKVLRFLTVKLQEEVNVEERLKVPVQELLPPEEYFEPPPETYSPRERYSGPSRSEGGEGGIDLDSSSELS